MKDKQFASLRARLLPRPLKKKDPGRPSVWEGTEGEKIVEKLEAGLRTGFTVEQACLFAGIDRGTYYNRIKVDEVFSTKMEQAQLFTTFASKRNINRAIIQDKSVADAWKWLEKKHPEEFGERDGTKVAVGVSVPIINVGKEISHERLAAEMVKYIESIERLRASKEERGVGSDEGESPTDTDRGSEA